MLRKPYRITIYLLFASFGCCGCGPAKTTPGVGREAESTDSRRQVTLALNWYPDAQHGGFYAAKHFGFYEEEGLRVKILPGASSAPVVQNVSLRRVDFGVGNADQILMARQQEAPVVVLMAPLQNSPRCIMVHRESGIERFEQLQDVRLAIGAGKAFARFMENRGLLNDVQVVPYTGGIAPFLNDKRFAQQAYVFSEPFVVRKKGADPLVLMVSELGFNPYTSCLFTHEETITKDPDLAEKMTRAVRRGWRAYLQHPEPVNRLIHSDNPEMDLESLQYAVDSIRPLCLPPDLDEAHVGLMTEKRWQTMLDQLVEIGFVDASMQASDAYRLQFVAEPLSN